MRSVQTEAGEYGAPQDKLAIDLKRSKRMVEAGSLWIPMAQTHWRLVAAALEPEGVGSYASAKLLGDVSPGVELALHRVVGLGAAHANALIAPALD